MVYDWLTRYTTLPTKLSDSRKRVPGGCVAAQIRHDGKLISLPRRQVCARRKVQRASNRKHIQVSSFGCDPTV